MTRNFRRKKSLFWALVALTAATAVVVRAAETNWLDIESRIQYAYYTEDTHALRNLVEPLAANDSPDRLKSYYSGLLAYRLTVLAQDQAEQAAREAGETPGPVRRNDRSKNPARQTVERCVSSLDQALQAQSNFADALALQAMCLDQLAQLSAWRVPFAGPKSASQMHKALQIAPHNPRVLLLDAINDYEHAKIPVTEAEHPCDKFKAVVAVFEAERTEVDRVPGWGAAEAYTWLGRCYLQKGDPIPARDALERALLIAPEFGQARRLLAAITSG